MKLLFSVFTSIALCLSFSALTRAQTPTPADVGQDARKEVADDAFAEAERKLTVRLIDKASAEADADAQLLSQVSSASKALSDRLTALQTNDDGKRLASALDEISAQQLQDLINQPPALPEALTAMDKEIQSTAADLKKLHDNPPAGFVLPDEQQDELVKDAVTLRQLLARVTERDEWVTSQLTTAPKSPDLTKAPTLEAALADFRRRQEQSWNAAQRQGIDEAKPEALQQITESAKTVELERALQHSQALLEQSRFDNEQSKLDLEMQLKVLREQKEEEVATLNRQLAESEAKTAVSNAQSDVIREKGNADAEHLRLVQKCQDPDVKDRLAPFITTGLWQPGDEPNRPWLHDRGPISLKALKAAGALSPTEKGLRVLYIVGNATNIIWPGQKHPDTERSKWGYANASARLSQSDWAEIKKAQDLLIELGDTLVEQKMLEP